MSDSVIIDDQKLSRIVKRIIQLEIEKIIEEEVKCC